MRISDWSSDVCSSDLANLHRRRGADIGARRHGGKVARIKKKGARTCRPGTAGADIGGDRHRRCQYVADDLPHGRIKAAGCIKPQDYQWCTPFGSVPQSVGNVGRARRPDRAVYIKNNRRRTRLGSKQEDTREQYRNDRSEEHTSELQSLMRISYAVFCLKKKKNKTYTTT